MANNIPFQPMGKTYRLNVTTGSSAELAINAYTPCNQVRVHNGTANEVAIRFAATTGNAAAFPVSGTPSDSMVLHNNQTQYFTVPQASISAQATLYVSAIGAASGYIYVTPGEGLS